MSATASPWPTPAVLWTAANAGMILNATNRDEEYTRFVRRILGLFAAGAAVCAGAGPDPAEVLSRLSAIVHEQTRRVPNYTCVQTIDRFFYLPASRPLPGRGREPRSCDERSRLNADRADRFRMEVRVGPDREMYSWVGASRFEDRSLRELLGFGPSSTGSFAPVLYANFGESAPDFHFTGEKTIEGQATYAYSFSVPAERSRHFFVMDDGSKVKMPYEGTIFANRETGAPVQVSVTVSSPPAESGFCRFSAELNYRRVRIGAGEFLLPSKALQTFFLPGGSKMESAISFSSCREFRAESRLVTDAADSEALGRAGDAPPPLPPIPAGLPVSITLSGSVDSATAAAGDPFTGRLANAVVDGSKNVIAPANALVRGRVSGVECLLTSSGVMVRLAIESIEIGGRDVTVRLAPKRNPRSATPPERGLLSRGVPIGDLPESQAMGQAVFWSRVKRYVIPDGTRTEWVTLGQP